MIFDLTTLAIVSVSCVFSFIFGAIVCFFVREAYFTRKISRLEEENEELHDSLYSNQQKDRNAKGLQAKEDKAARMQGAMFEFATAMQGGAKIEEVVKQLAGKYPDIAMDLVKKGVKI